LTGATVSVTGQGALPEYEVDARDAHAWPELYFQGLGWVPFEPTPSRGVVPDYAVETFAASAPGALENNDDLVPDATPAPAPAPTAAPLPLPGSGGTPDAATRLVPWLLGAGGLLGLALLAATPRLIRTGIRARRLRPAGPVDAVPLAWSEMMDLGTDYGLPPGPSETPRAYSARLRGSALLGDAGGLASAAHQAAAVLTTEFERHKYGPPAPGMPVTGQVGAGSAVAEPAPGGNSQVAGARIAAVEDALRANAPALRRLRALWLPPSVVGRLGRLLAAPFAAAGAAVAKAAKAAARTLSARWSARS
jgi:hypothetical protein